MGFILLKLLGVKNSGRAWLNVLSLIQMVSTGQLGNWDQRNPHFQDCFFIMPGSFFFLDLSHSPQGLISSIAYPYGLGFSQFGGLRAFALLKWRLASKRQEAGMPDQLRKMPETRRTSLPPYSIGQSSHRTPPDLGAGDLDSALC